MESACKGAWTFLAAWIAIAGLSVPFQAAGAADRELGEYIAGQCTTCHRTSSDAVAIPSIAGWDEQSFIVVMQSYKKKERTNEVMQNIAGSLTDEEIAALAAYFATVKQGN